MPTLKHYRIQHDMYSCGPVSLYNFLVWAGLKPRVQDMKLMRKLLGTKPKNGTDFDSILNFMSMFGEQYNISVGQTRSITSPLRTLQDGGSFLMIYDGGDGKGHIAFCRGIIGGKISIINAVRGTKDLRLTKLQFKALLLNNKSIPLFVTIRKKR